MENGKVANNLSAYYEKKKTPTVKSYRNADFLNSDAGRNIRIQCELEESKWRLSREGVHGKISCRLYWSCAVYSTVFIRWCVVCCGVAATVLVFGSARAKSRAQFDESIKDLNVS